MNAEYFSFPRWLTMRGAQGGMERWCNRYLIAHVAAGIAGLFIQPPSVQIGQYFAFALTGGAMISFAMTHLWMLTKELDGMFGIDGVRSVANYLQYAITVVGLNFLVWGLIHPDSPRWQFGIAFFMMSFAIVEAQSSFNVVRVFRLAVSAMIEVDKKQALKSESMEGEP